MERSANRMFDMDQNRINEGGSLGRMREEWINAAATQEVERGKTKGRSPFGILFAGIVSSLGKSFGKKKCAPEKKAKKASTLSLSKGQKVLVVIACFMLVFGVVYTSLNSDATANTDAPEVMATNPEANASAEPRGIAFASDSSSTWLSAEDVLSNNKLLDTIRAGAYPAFDKAAENNRIASPDVIKFVSAGELYCTGINDEAKDHNMLIEIFKITGENRGQLIEYYWYVKFPNFREEGGNIRYDGGNYEMMQTASCSFGEMVVTGSATMEDLLLTLEEEEQLSNYSIEKTAIKRH